MTDPRSLEPDFVDALERELRSEMRRRDRFHPTPRAQTASAAWTVALLAVALLLGAGSVVAAQEVHARGRRRLEVARIEVILQGTESRRALVARDLAEMENRRDAGLVSEAEVGALRERAAALAVALEHQRLDLFEVSRTGEPVRSELSAPLVEGRDLVRERLQIDLAEARARHERLVAARDRTRTLVDAGVAPTSDLDAAETSIRVIGFEESEIEQRLAWRADYVAGKIPPMKVDLLGMKRSAALRREASEAHLATAHAILERARSLFAGGFVSREEVSAAEAAVAVLDTDIRLQQAEERILDTRLRE
ncbi:MAG: hypothetical protein HYR85_03190 [Planctomycetes bacterium]|nr:hypothetical protein [Planctomycetota bacterium]MBI3848219.1 hypothetical protein [Planctomycetota bacterium]